jgi:hypothetical protein
MHTKCTAGAWPHTDRERERAKELARRDRVHMHTKCTAGALPHTERERERAKELASTGRKKAYPRTVWPRLSARRAAARVAGFMPAAGAPTCTMPRRKLYMYAADRQAQRDPHPSQHTLRSLLVRYTHSLIQTHIHRCTHTYVHTHTHMRRTVSVVLTGGGVAPSLPWASRRGSACASSQNVRCASTISCPRSSIARLKSRSSKALPAASVCTLPDRQTDRQTDR